LTKGAIFVQYFEASSGSVYHLDKPKRGKYCPKFAMRYDKFTQKAQESIAAAQEVLDGYNHQELDTEHIFLALLRQEDGLVAKILKRMDIMPDMVQRKIEATLEVRPKVYGGATAQIYITPRTKKLFALARSEAERMKDEYVGCEHLFLALTD
jgi:ATP-dependent Clp protease ATP-binding subunit ClpC